MALKTVIAFFLRFARGPESCIRSTPMEKSPGVHFHCLGLGSMRLSSTTRAQRRPRRRGPPARHRQRRTRGGPLMTARAAANRRRGPLVAPETNPARFRRRDASRVVRFEGAGLRGRVAGSRLGGTSGPTHAGTSSVTASPTRVAASGGPSTLHAVKISAFATLPGKRNPFVRTGEASIIRFPGVGPARVGSGDPNVKPSGKRLRSHRAEAPTPSP